MPKPIREWEDGNFIPCINEAIKKLKYQIPTPIQMQAIPIGMERKDLIGIAPTGSGKSAAFLIPLITQLIGMPPITEENSSEGPYALILTPARELTIQIDNEFQKFAAGTHLRSVVMVGGREVGNQAIELRKGGEVLMGTPGRVKDAIQNR